MLKVAIIDSGIDWDILKNNDALREQLKKMLSL